MLGTGRVRCRGDRGARSAPRDAPVTGEQRNRGLLSGASNQGIVTPIHGQEGQRLEASHAQPARLSWNGQAPPTNGRDSGPQLAAQARRRSRTRMTCIAVHALPVAVLMPRSFSAFAAARCDRLASSAKPAAAPPLVPRPQLGSRPLSPPPPLPNPPAGRRSCRIRSRPWSPQARSPRPRRT